MKGEIGAKDHAGLGDTDAWGADGGRTSVGAGRTDTSSQDDTQASIGSLRPSVAHLRERALLERSRRPKTARRIVIDVGLATGRSFADIAGLTISEVEYVMRRHNRG